MKRDLNHIAIIILTALALVVSGCQSTTSFYQGKQVDTEHVVTLSADSGRGNWSTFDLHIDYEYQAAGPELELSGHVALSEHYQMNYGGLRKLEVYLLLLDDNSRVLKTAKIINPNTYDLNERFPFRLTMMMPGQTVAFSFAYDGITLETGEDKKRGSPSFFWHRPK